MEPEYQKIYDLARRPSGTNLWQFIAGFDDDPADIVKRMILLNNMGVIHADKDSLNAMGEFIGAKQNFSPNATVGDRRQALMTFALRPGSLPGGDHVWAEDLDRR